MAELFVPKIIDQLTDVASKQIGERVSLAMGVEEEVKNLTFKLTTIKRVLQDAERRKLKENDVEVWLEKLEDITYEMEYVLDDWNIKVDKPRNLDQRAQVKVSRMPTLLKKMAFQDQSGSWSNGGNYWNNQSCNQWNTQDNSFQVPQVEPSPNQSFQWSNNASPSSDNNLEQQMARNQSDLVSMFASLSTIVELFQEHIKKYNQELDQQAKRMTAMEQAQSKRDEIINAQSEKIKSLEETVSTLQTRLKHQQHEQTHQYAANLRRIKQLNVEVPQLRDRLKWTGAKLRHIQNEQDAAKDGTKKLLFSSSNSEADSEAEEEQKPRSEGHLEFPDPEMTSSCCQTVPSKDLDNIFHPHDEDIQAACEQLWGCVQGQLDKEDLQQLHEIVQGKTENSPYHHIEKEISQLNRNMTAFLGTITVLESNSEAKEDKLKKMSTAETGMSCNDCGSNCKHQLRACINMIKVRPSLTKVNEVEVQAMKNKQKRKLQRRWVPRGIFDIKELLDDNTNFSEVQCANQLMPRWKRRKRRPPVIHDSGN